MTWRLETFPWGFCYHDHVLVKWLCKPLLEYFLEEVQFTDMALCPSLCWAKTCLCDITHATASNCGSQGHLGQDQSFPHMTVPHIPKDATLAPQRLLFCTVTLSKSFNFALMTQLSVFWPSCVLNITTNHKNTVYSRHWEHCQVCSFWRAVLEVRMEMMEKKYSFYTIQYHLKFLPCTCITFIFKESKIEHYCWVSNSSRVHSGKAMSHLLQCGTAGPCILQETFSALCGEVTRTLGTDLASTGSTTWYRRAHLP